MPDGILVVDHMRSPSLINDPVQLCWGLNNRLFGDAATRKPLDRKEANTFGQGNSKSFFRFDASLGAWGIIFTLDPQEEDQL